MLTILAFLVAIGILVGVHEWGHFAAARACGVRVLCFSVGMGPAVLRWKSSRTGTDYVIGCLPIGGYVKMHGEVDDGSPVAGIGGASFADQHGFKKASIVIAGPLANLLFAVVLFASLGWYGVEQAQPILSAPAPHSRLAQAGLAGGERVLSVGFARDEWERIQTFEDLRWWLAKAATEGQVVGIEYVRSDESAIRRTEVSLQGLNTFVEGDGAAFYREIGLLVPFSSPVLGTIQGDGAAFAAGLRTGDRVLVVDHEPVADAAQLRERILEAGATGVSKAQQWEVQRGESKLTMPVTPKVVYESRKAIGRVGAVIGQRPEMVTVRYGLFEGWVYGMRKTWDLCAITWRTLGRMLIGQGTLQQLSGPLTIADYAGKSAAMGLQSFVSFLALLSVSLGVLNLLPIPVLDGGQLMYYLWESLCGRPVPAIWAERLQKAGLVVLVLMMSLAISNDVARLLQ